MYRFNEVIRNIRKNTMIFSFDDLFLIITIPFTFASLWLTINGLNKCCKNVFI